VASLACSLQRTATAMAHWYVKLHWLVLPALRVPRSGARLPGRMGIGAAPPQRSKCVHVRVCVCGGGTDAPWTVAMWEQAPRGTSTCPWHPAAAPNCFKVRNQVRDGDLRKVGEMGRVSWCDSMSLLHCVSVVPTRSARGRSSTVSCAVRW
jgi:hypothetical protein